MFTSAGCGELWLAKVALWQKGRLPNSLQILACKAFSGGDCFALRPDSGSEFSAFKEDEIRNHKDKEDRLLSVDATGQIHIKNATIKVEADLSSDLLVRFALTRRGLALEQAGLLSYALREKWAENSFIPGIVSSLLDMPASAPSRFCRQISRLSLSLPTCAVQGFSWKPLAGPWIKCGIANKGKGKKGKGSKGGQKGANARVPDDVKGCHSCASKGNPICFDYQQGNCQRPVTLNRCARGLHVCGICFANNHTMQNCNKRNAVE